MHLGVAAMLLAAGCSGSALPVAPSVPDTGSKLFTVSIDAAASTVGIGRTLALTLSGQDERGGDAPVGAATWKSSDARVATVDARGVVTGVKKGRVTITATTKNPAREATLTLDVLADQYGGTVSTGAGSLGTPNLHLDVSGATVLGIPAGQMLDLVITPLVESVVNPLVQALDTQLLDPVLTALGVNVAGADYTSRPIADCGTPRMVG